MSDFATQIRGELDLKQAESSMQSFLNKYKNEALKIKVDFNDSDNKSFANQARSQMQKAGENAGKSYSTAMQTQIETMARTQRNAFSQPLNNMTKEQKAYSDWWNKELDRQNKSFNQIDATIAGNKTLTWLKNNSAAAKDYGEILKNLAEKQKLSTSGEELRDYTKQVNNIKAQASMLGKTGKSFGEEFKRAFTQIGQFALNYGVIQKGVDTIVKSVSELKEVDSILTEISKTSDMTTNQLKQLGETSFDSASKWGKKATDYLLSIQEMSRSGYYGKQAEEMANVTLLAQAAGDMNAELANSYTLASNAAYQYQGDVTKLTALLDGQNSITNRNSVSMQDMAAATTKAASMASELGVAENQLSAMIGTMEARTKAGGDKVGTAIKSLLINVENINNSKIVDTFAKAGVAQTEFINGIERMRNPIDILKDLSKVFNSLEESDPLRTEILTNIGQKYQANQLSSLLSGWSDYEKMLKDYSEGTGSAAIEAEKSANNWEGSMNKLANAWTSLVQNFTNSDVIKTAINMLTGLTSGIDAFTTSLGSVASLTTVFSLFKGLKGEGKTNCRLQYSLL